MHESEPPLLPVIRPEEPDDYAAIGEVNRVAFGQEDEARLVEALRRSSDYIPQLSLVGLIEGRIIGHILFSPVVIETPERDVPTLALAPMAVHPDFQRRGIGSALVREGLKVCQRLGHASVVVLGHPGYYPRFGFVPGLPRGIQPPFETPPGAFMVCELRPGALAGVHGTVRYPPVFG
jgi:putative acetyltransferase